jgi:hypothetical protein
MGVFFVKKSPYSISTTQSEGFDALSVELLWVVKRFGS